MGLSSHRCPHTTAINGGANVINPSSKNQHHAGAGVADPSLSYDQAPPHAPALPQFVTVKALNHRNGHRRNLHKLCPQPVQSLRVWWVVVWEPP